MSPSCSLPPELSILEELSLDLRWVWSHESDALWSRIDEELWEKTHNPWLILQNTAQDRLASLVSDLQFRAELDGLVARRKQYLESAGWFRGGERSDRIKGIAYFSMEFGLGAALPLYAGGLGVLAGDFLKTASDLDVPVIGVGLLYQEGYFRQIIDSNGMQEEFYPYNEPATLPIRQVVMADGSPLRICLELPGRLLQLRAWHAAVGRRTLYLLDSNDPLNTAPDRGITAKLYGGGPETRLLQEIVLGVGGWRLVETLHPEVEICHINEGHAAFAVLERARQFATRNGIGFWDALWATRAGNIFTTHTPVPAGFDRYPASMLTKYLPGFTGSHAGEGASPKQLLGLGREHAEDDSEPFNMAFLARRGTAVAIGVSRLHGDVSRHIFQPLFPRWPTHEVPVSHITNGVHVPSWDSAEADRLWTSCCGKERWRSQPLLSERIAEASDEALWIMRAKGRFDLVAHARKHILTQLGARGASPEAATAAGLVLDPNILTFGFARRFTEYKRTNLLLRDPDRLGRILLDQRRPAQLVIAGKADPADRQGKDMIRQWIEFASDEHFRQRVVFLEDYDLDLAQHLVEGVDVWINTPRRPWEACGTSGMKTLVNGGLNCSVLDGWWDEAFSPDVGWAVGDGRDAPPDVIDKCDMDDLFDLIEGQIAPEFYDRDASGMPRRWLQRIRASMATLTNRFSSARMMNDYVSDIYSPLAEAFRDRVADGGARAVVLNAWHHNLSRQWEMLRIGSPVYQEMADDYEVKVRIYPGEIETSSIRVELYADAREEHPPACIRLDRTETVIGATNGYFYAGRLSKTRDIADFTVRVTANHPEAFLPAEAPFIAWHR
ncbi:alpha-glucan family phosphorylase [Rhizobium binxianense]